MRIDVELVPRFGSRNKAAKAIEDGRVLVNGRQVSPDYRLKEGDKLQIVPAEENYVSIGGFKLSKAIKDFSFDAKDKIFADIGASTGGFTDCLLKNGAKKVYCIDVGESQLDKCLSDKNIVVIDNFNARNLTPEIFDERLDGAVIDVSFISLTYVLKGVADCLENGAEVIALIKPQFECENRTYVKNGIVKDSKIRKKIIEKIYNFAIECKLIPINLTTAPIVKGKNTEYLILLKKGEYQPEKCENMLKSVKL